MALAWTLADPAAALAAADRRRMVKLILLLERTLDISGARSSRELLQEIWHVGAQRAASEFINHGTPFFWKNVSRCFGHSPEEPQSLLTLLGYLAQTAF